MIFWVFLDENFILKKKGLWNWSKMTKIPIFQKFQLCVCSRYSEMCLKRSAQVSSLAEIFYYAQLQKFMILSQKKETPPPKKKQQQKMPFFLGGGVGLHIHLIQDWLGQLNNTLMSFLVSLLNLSDWSFIANYYEILYKSLLQLNRSPDFQN